MTTAKRVIRALVRIKARSLFDAIEDNKATPGEVVLWPYGKPVYSVKQALDFAMRMEKLQNAKYAHRGVQQP